MTFILKYDVQETALYLSLQVESTQMGPVEKASLCLRTPATPPIKKLRGLSPQANYTDRATAACQRN
jgi:hypothetical protein